jgi:tRNA G18 (ribose-2'-O)-methylase SpoU
LPEERPIPGDLAERVTVVEDPADPRIVDYRELRERNLETRQTFIAESEVVLRVLLASGRHPVRSLLLAEGRLAKLADALRALPPAVPIYLASQTLLSQIVGFRLHRGILAAAERIALPAPEELLGALGPGRRRVVVLESLTNHDNVGGVFRNAAAFGADAVLLDHATCDPLYRKAIRVSVGASLLVPYARAESALEIAEALTRHGFARWALSPAGTEEISETRAPERLALMLGTEGAGLSQTILAGADRRVRIAMASGFDSLNVATASGVALYLLAAR